MFACFMRFDEASTLALLAGCLSRRCKTKAPAILAYDVFTGDASSATTRTCYTTLGMIGNLSISSIFYHALLRWLWGVKFLKAAFIFLSFLVQEWTENRSNHNVKDNSCNWIMQYQSPISVAFRVFLVVTIFSDWNRRVHSIVRRKSRMVCGNTFLACTSISLYILKEIHYKFGIFNGPF